MGELLDKYIEQIVLDVHYNCVKNLMESFGVTMEQAMDAIKLPESDRDIISKRF